MTSQSPLLSMSVKLLATVVEDFDWSGLKRIRGARTSTSCLLLQMFSEVVILH